MPKSIQDKIRGVPKHGYGARLVTVILEDGREYYQVLIAWSKEGIHASGYEKVLFNAKRVVDVKDNVLNRGQSIT